MADTSARPGTDTVIGWLAMAAAFTSTSRYWILLPGLPGLVTAGIAVEVSSAPVTWKVAVRVIEPATAVTVTSRFDRSEPIDTLAVAAPFVSVTGPETWATALLSTLIRKGTPASVLRSVSTAVTVATTVLAPELSTLPVLNDKLRSAAVGAAAGADAAPLAGPDAAPEAAPEAAPAEASEEALPAPVPNGEVPALPPPPPHATSCATSASAPTCFIMFMRSTPGFGYWTVLRSVMTFGVRKISISFLLLVLVRVLNRLPR